MNIENISRFLETNYNDEQLAALLAHAENGRLSYNSCCCLVGIPLATHALRGENEYDFDGEPHLERGRELPWAKEAESEFALLGPDRTRRRILMPLVLAEMERRERKKAGDRVIGKPTDPAVEISNQSPRRIWSPEESSVSVVGLGSPDHPIIRSFSSHY